MNGKNQVIRNARPTQKELNWMWKVNRNFISSACDLVSRVFLRFIGRCDYIGVRFTALNRSAHFSLLSQS